MLDSLARVLLLDEHETRFLHRLADEDAVDEPLEADLSPAELATLLVRDGETSPYPLYVFNVYCDLIAWNQAVTTYYTDFAKLPIERQNMMWWLIATTEAKTRLAEWEADTRDIVARWRKVTSLMANTRRPSSKEVVVQSVQRGLASTLPPVRSSGAASPMRWSATADS